MLEGKSARESTGGRSWMERDAADPEAEESEEVEQADEGAKK